MRYSDRPIIRPGHDVLGRATFALELARAVDNLSVAQDGFVIGVVGEWGSGKTSVLELVLRYLRHIEMERASQTTVIDGAKPVLKTLVDLEEMSGTFELIEARLETLAAANRNLTYWHTIGRKREFQRWLPSKEAAAVADRYWQLLCHVRQHPKTIVIRFSPWPLAGHVELAAALLSELARALGERLGDSVKQAFAALLTRLSEFAPLAGAGLDVVTGTAFGQVMSLGGKLSSRVADRMASGPTLEELRTQLRNALGLLEQRRILVVIDDLDRLTPPEALQMASLVKSLGDLPNVIYLLSYDDRKLNELINKATGVDGHNFLKKIVQYSVHLPPPTTDDLTRLLDSDLTAILGALSVAEQARLGATWHHIFRHYLRTPRDVRRYANAISVAISPLADYLDRIDLILLEALRMYEPDVYWWLRRNLADITE